MGKSFREWHTEKGDLHEHKVRAFFYEREVWFASLGVNVGFEQDGRGERFLRPVIVLKKFNVDSKRLQYKIGDIPKPGFEEIKEKLRQLLV